MNRKGLMKHDCVKNKNFEATEICRILQIQITINYTKRVCNDFETKKLGKYHDLYLNYHYYWLMFLETLENLFRNLSIKPRKIYFSSRISLAISIKKDQSRIRIIDSY